MRTPDDEPPVPLHEWPGVFARYAFLAGSGGNATLRFEVAFDPAQAGQAPAALERYRTLHGQLTDARTVVSVTTSLASGPASPATANGDDLKTALAGFAGAIVASLDPDTAGPSPAPVVLSATVPISHVAELGADLFPIWATVEIGRDEAPGVSSLLVPAAAEGALHEWALDFEAAFAGFDGSGGVLKVLADDPSAPGGVWALRWSETGGVSVSFANAGAEAAGAPAYFSRMPLATRLVLGEAAIHDYAPDGAPAPTPRTASFKGADLDGWASEFLKAFGGWLDLGASIEKLDADLHERLVEAHKSIASALALSVSPTFEDQTPHGEAPGAGDLEAARTRLRDDLLASLDTDLASAAIVQVPATVAVRSPVQTDDPSSRPAELIGAPTAEAAGPHALSAATLPLANGTPELGFLAAAVDPASSADLRLRALYHVSGVDPLAHEWPLLHLVVDDDALHVPMGDLDVPVPLHAYPPRAQLVEQSIGAAHDPPATLSQAVEASYALTLARPSAAQDDLHISILLNGAPPEHDEREPLRGAPLLAPLARLLDFQTRYAKTAATAIRAGAPDAAQWARAVVALLEEVTAAWGTQGSTAETGTSTCDFVLRVPDQTKPNRLLLWRTGTNLTPDPGWPTIEGMEGAPAPDGAMAYTLGSSADGAQPTLVWTDLSVLTNQSISATARIVRNDCLAGGGRSHRPRTTNPSLVYRGPAVAFPAPAVPGLEVPGRLTIRSTSLGDAVTQLVTGVMQPSAPEAQVDWDLQVAYSFAPASGEGQPRSEVPVLRVRTSVTTAATPPPDVRTPAQYAAAIEEALADWHRDLAPSGEGAAVRFAVTLFATGGDRPLVRLPDVEAPVAQPGWWPAG
jgi:hypothetical protein